MERRNRYKNPVRFIAVFRIVFICLLLGAVGGVFVHARNQHVKQGDQIRQVENDIDRLSEEKELWQLRNAAAKDRKELKERLRWIGSDLEPIKPSRVITIEQ